MLQKANNIKDASRSSTRATAREHISISRLRQVLKGQVIEPGDTRYDAARTIFAGGIDKRPAVIVQAATASDVSHVVSLARDNGLELAVRSGGHSGAGHSASEGGIVLDLCMMKGMDIDPGTRTAWAETGLTAGELTTAASVHGLAPVFGDTSSVGIGGITLGGGVGYLVRKYGLTIDNLLAADMVTADGRLIRTNPQTHPELFWAIRGGGGNFGIATRFQYRLQDVGVVMGGMLILPATPETIEGFIAEADAAPEELSAIINIMPAPPMPFLPAEAHGKLVTLAMMVYAGDVDEGQRVYAPFRALAKPVADMIRPLRYPEMYPPEDKNYHPQAVGRTLFMNNVDREAGRLICETLQASDASIRVVQLRVLGGAVQRVPVEATAYAHRNSRIMANVASFYTTPEDRIVREAWVKNFAGLLQQDDEGIYVNFLNGGGEQHVRKAYPGPTWDRLRRIKARYDPDNLFRMNHNIPPYANAAEPEN